MSWAKIDDKLHSHPKVIGAGYEAMGLFLLGLSWSADYLTDGFVPQMQVRRLLVEADDPLVIAQRLVEAGLWDEVEDGYQVHDYLEYNPSAEKVKADRAAAKERMRELREGRKPEPNKEERSPEVPPNFNDPDPVPDPAPDPGPESEKITPSAGARVPTSPPSKPEKRKPEPKSKSPPLTAGQRGFLDLFGAKRYKTIPQREAVEKMEREHGTEKLLAAARWAAERGMSVGQAVGSVRTALPKWGKAKKRGRGSSPEPYQGLKDWLAEQEAQ